MCHLDYINVAGMGLSCTVTSLGLQSLCNRSFMWHLCVLCSKCRYSSHFKECFICTCVSLLYDWVTSPPFSFICQIDYFFLSLPLVFSIELIEVLAGVTVVDVMSVKQIG